MKLGCIATSNVPSNTANSIQVMKVCHALRQTENEVHLWVPGKQGSDWDTLSDFYGIHQQFEVSWLSENRFWRRYDFALKAVWKARTWHADAIYTWTPQAAVLALDLGIPTVLELHDLPTGRFGPYLYRRFVTHRGNKRLLLITHALREKLENLYGIPLQSDQVQIAPNGTEIDRYGGLPDAPAARKQLGFPEMPTAVYTGHFYAGRGMDLLHGLAKNFPNINFLWIGGRPQDVQAWKVRFEQDQITNVILTGFIENQRLPLYQAAGDFLLMPYDRLIEGSSGGNSAAICSPMKMFDYLAAGRVIMTSDLPVLHEVLNPKNAVFCPPQDLNGWSEKLNELLENVELREQLACQAKQDAQKYTWIERADLAVENLL